MALGVTGHVWRVKEFITHPEYRAMSLTLAGRVWIPVGENKRVPSPGTIS
jgi:hypothetical protein